MMHTDKAIYQVGIVSYGSLDCDVRKSANVYTSVSGYMDWIYTAMSALESAP